MDELIKYIIDYLSKYLKFEFALILIIVIGIIYIWHLYLRNKLLKEQIEFERVKREEVGKQIINFEKTYKIEYSDERKIQTINTKKTNRILIVDDETSVRELLSYSLRDFKDTEIFKAKDGLEAIEKMQEIQPTILVTDLVMPRLSGIDLIHKIRKRGIDIPIIAISGYFSKTSISDLNIHSNRKIIFLMKPFLTSNFIEIIKDLIK